MWNNFNQPYSSYNYPYNAYRQNSYNFPQQTSYVSQPQQQQNQAQNNIFWVRGKENARSTQLSPNSTMLLMDNEQNKFYIKTTDDIGLGRLRVFNYTEQLEEQKPVEQTNLYVTKDQLENFMKEIRNSNEQLIRRIEQSQSNSNDSKSSGRPVIIKKEQS